MLKEDIFILQLQVFQAWDRKVPATGSIIIQSHENRFSDPTSSEEKSWQFTISAPSPKQRSPRTNRKPSLSGENQQQLLCSVCTIRHSGNYIPCFRINQVELLPIPVQRATAPYEDGASLLFWPALTAAPESQ
ncbi:MAG: hypothetical protein A3G20_01515 [Acidobacteria bacterium RIFCSPLOWO2_12_FULL_59_11]|nr:MAG: hypothetical protein A3G20_01515 [Acidobacteria bacterium RIFCSPLOWO2_12_FULL_59_11]